MDFRSDFVDAVGNTPLIKLRKASELTGCTILGKAEFLNPGGSVKDRAAKYMVLDGERRGVIEPGGLIVEGTAGNTGIGLALVGNSRGYRTLILMPNTQSQEKKDALRLCGAELREVPAVPFKDPNNYVHIAARTAKELEATEPHGVLYANQWDNTANRDGHTQSTGPEIWRQTDGKVDGFICAVGTGGTLAGTSAYLEAEESERRVRGRGPDGRVDLQLDQDGRAQRLRQLDQRRHRPRPRHGQFGRREDRRRVPDPGQRDGADLLRPRAERGAAARRLHRHQRRGRDPARASSSGPARPSSRSSATRARAISRSSTTPSSCERRTCRRRRGSRRAERERGRSPRIAVAPLRATRARVVSARSGMIQSRPLKMAAMLRSATRPLALCSRLTAAAALLAGCASAPATTAPRPPTARPLRARPSAEQRSGAHDRRRRRRARDGHGRRALPLRRHRSDRRVRLQRPRVLRVHAGRLSAFRARRKNSSAPRARSRSATPTPATSCSSRIKRSCRTSASISATDASCMRPRAARRSRSRA